MVDKLITFTVKTKDLLTGQQFPILFQQWSLFSTIPNYFQH